MQNGHPCTASAADVKIQVVIFTALFYFIGNSIGEDMLVEVLVGAHFVFKVGNKETGDVRRRRRRSFDVSRW